MSESGRTISSYTMYVFAKEKYMRELLRSGRITQEQFDKMDKLLYARFNISEIEDEIDLSILSRESELSVIRQTVLETPESNMSTPSKTPPAKSVPVVKVPSDIEYVSLTELARGYNPSNPGYLIQLWLQNQNTIELISLWEESNNPHFNLEACEEIQSKLRDSAFTLTAKNWIEQTGGIGLHSKSGRYGGTFAHPIIACDFLSGLSPKFKLSLIEMNRLVIEGAGDANV